MAQGHDAVSKLQAPATVAALGVPEGLAEDLFMRRVLVERMTTIGRAADALAVSHAVGDELAESLRQKSLLEYHGLDGRDYRVSLTEAGHKLTTERMRSGSHVAKMPVPISDYRTLVGAQRSTIRVTRTTAKQAFADLVLEDGLLDRIGPAFVSDGAIFFYGPPGTGKTSLAERMARFYDDRVLIPRYLEVESQLIMVFDPAAHEPAEQQPPQLDPRYVLCKRPLIMVGGELTMPMMDLQYDPISGLSTAPIQLLANNGILVLDDFGRQTASPDEILNRWIVPLSRGVDFLRPNTGNKFTVPFELKLIISTNLDPHSLGDDAFLRRLRNKVYVGACSEAAFNWILVRSADRKGLEVSQEAAAYLVDVTRAHLGELRPYVAIDICELAIGMCEYDGLSHRLNARLIDRVASVYFVQGADGAPVLAPSAKQVVDGADAEEIEPDPGPDPDDLAEDGDSLDEHFCDDADRRRPSDGPSTGPAAMFSRPR
ncbi:MAG: AAA family ATPase [Actinomycetota bacterium]